MYQVRRERRDVAEIRGGLVDVLLDAHVLQPLRRHRSQRSARPSVRAAVERAAPRRAVDDAAAGVAGQQRRAGADGAAVEAQSEVLVVR